MAGRASVWAVLGLLAVAAAAAAQVPVTTVVPDAQVALLQSHDEILARNKHTVFDYWRVVRQAGRVEQLSEYVDTAYVSHDPGMPGGREGLATALARPRQQPLRSFVEHLVNIVAEGDLVMLETLNVIDDPDDRAVQYQNVDHDVFRLRAGKIVEHWGSPRIAAEQVFAVRKAPPKHAMPSLPGGASADAVPLDSQRPLLDSRDPQLARNKRAAFDNWRIVIEAGRLDLADRYMDEDYIQHNPVIPSGRQALVDFLKPILKPRSIADGIEGLKFLIAERDIVVLVLTRMQDGRDMVLFDVFRVKDGKVAEHWDCVRTASEVGMTRRGEPGIRPVASPVKINATRTDAKPE